MSDARISVFAARAIFDARLNPTDIRVLAVFGTNLSGQGWCEANQARIGAGIGLKRQTVNASIKRLVACGYLEAKGRIGDKKERITSLYRVALDTPDGAELPDVFAPTPVNPVDRGCQPNGQAQDVGVTAAKQPQHKAPPVSPVDSPCPSKSTARKKEEDLILERESISDPRAERADKKTRFDRRWTSLSATSREYAAKNDFVNGSADAMFEDFRAYHLAKGSVMWDWSAAWQYWVRRAVKIRAERNADERTKRNDPNANRRARYSAVARVLEARRMARAEGKTERS